MHVGQFLSNTL